MNFAPIRVLVVEIIFLAFSALAIFAGTLLTVGWTGHTSHRVDINSVVIVAGIAINRFIVIKLANLAIRRA